MGAWGTAVFSDDTAADVRLQFRELVGQGLSTSEATERLIAEWANELQDPDVAPVFWLALAASQWKLGRLTESVRQSALRVIADGSDLARWEDNPRQLASRRRHLEKLRATLLSEPPPPRRVTPTFKNSCDWATGEVICYQMASGTRVWFRTIGFHSDMGGTAPVCEILDWAAERPPEAEVASITIRQRVDGRDPQLMIGAVSAQECPTARLSRFGVRGRPSQSPRFYFVALWRYLDRMLVEQFGFK